MFRSVAERAEECRLWVSQIQYSSNKCLQPLRSCNNLEYTSHARRLCRLGGRGEILRLVWHCMRPRDHPDFHAVASPRITAETLVNAATEQAMFERAVPPLD